MITFPPLPVGGKRGVFSDLCHDNPMGLLEVKLMKVWVLSETGPPGIFNFQSQLTLSLQQFIKYTISIPMGAGSRYNFSCCCSITKLCPTLQPHGLQHARLSCCSGLLEFAQVHVHWIGDATQPSYPLSPSYLSAFSLSQHQGLFQWVGSSHQMAKVLKLQLLHQFFPMNIQGWISFNIDWFDLPAVQWTLKSLLQLHSLKASILWCSAFFMVQLSHPYMTTRKTIALTRWTK